MHRSEPAPASAPTSLGVALVLVTVFIIALAIGVTSYTIYQAGERSEEKRDLPRMLRTTLADQEASFRGFLLSGETPEQDEYERSKEEFDRALVRGRQLLADQPEHLERLDAIESSARQWQRVSEARIDERTENAFEFVPDRMRARARLMDSVRDDVTDLRQLLDEDARAIRERAVLVPVAITIVLGLVAAAVGAAMLHRSRRTHSMLAALRGADERYQQAFEINDAIVQRLVVADMARMVGNDELAATSVTHALADAKALISRMAEGAAPGSLVRSEAADVAPTQGAHDD